MSRLPLRKHRLGKTNCYPLGQESSVYYLSIDVFSTAVQILEAVNKKTNKLNQQKFVKNPNL